MTQESSDLHILQAMINASLNRLIPGYTTPRAQAEAAGFAKPEPVDTGDWNDLGYTDLPIDTAIVDAYQIPRCMAHGSESCAPCGRIAEADLLDGGCRHCSTYATDGMHWDTCQARIRGPILDNFRVFVAEPYLAQIDKTIETLARIAEVPSYFMTEDGRVRVEPPKYHTWVQDYDTEHVRPGWDDLTWHTPSSMTLELRGVALETMEIAFGGSLIPLCQRQIPAEGTE